MLTWFHFLAAAPGQYVLQTWLRVVWVPGQLAALCKPQRWAFEDSQLHFHTPLHIYPVYFRKNIGPFTFTSSCEPKHLCMCIYKGIKEEHNLRSLCADKKHLCVWEPVAAADLLRCRAAPLRLVKRTYQQVFNALGVLVMDPLSCPGWIWNDLMTHSTSFTAPAPLHTYWTLYVHVLQHH